MNKLSDLDNLTPNQVNEWREELVRQAHQLGEIRSLLIVNCKEKQTLGKLGAEYDETYQPLHNLVAILELLVNQIGQLQTIVDKLPKTDNDVPIVPGETYYAGWDANGDDDDEDCVRWIVQPCRYVGHAEPHVEYEWEMEDWLWEDGCNESSFSVYSTREAAEAAGKGGE